MKTKQDVEREAHERLAKLLDWPYHPRQYGYPQWRKDVDKAVWEYAKALAPMVAQ